MSLNIGTMLRRVLTPAADRPRVHVHFHAGSGGRLYACDIDRCESARLTEGEVIRLGR
jgi:hypothetical protein